MPLCLIPDEVSHDPGTAFELARRWGIERFEIRYAYRWRVPVGPDWVAGRVAALVAEHGVRVGGVSPGLFKPTMQTDGSTIPIGIDTPDEIRRHLDELLPRCFAFAERVGTRHVTVFALPRGAAPAGSEAPQIVIDTLGAAAARAEPEGFELRVENVAGSWADHGAAAAAILAAVNSPALRLTWDPANVAHALADEDPVETGYPLVRRFVANVHVKDVAMTGGKPTWTMLGDGIIDWPAQLRRLAADGYRGPITAEPHLQYVPGCGARLVETVERFVTRLRKLIHSTRGLTA